MREHEQGAWQNKVPRDSSLHAKQCLLRSLLGNVEVNIEWGLAVYDDARPDDAGSGAPSEWQS